MKTFKTLKSELIEALIQKGRQLGSNPGGLHVDDETGEEHYVKFPKNPDQGKVEVLASKIHDLMGINTIPSENRMINNKPAVVSKWVHGLTPMKLNDVSKLSPEDHHQIGKLFAAAILTRNHDIVGTGLDHNQGNLYLDKNNKLYHGDVGGSFHFRAMGGSKPYENDISEINSLRNKDIAPEAAHIFNTTFHMTPDAEKHGYDTVKNLDDSKVYDAFKNSGLHNWEDLHNTFKDRKQAFLNHYENV